MVSTGPAVACIATSLHNRADCVADKIFGEPKVRKNSTIIVLVTSLRFIGKVSSLTGGNTGAGWLSALVLSYQPWHASLMLRYTLFRS